MTLTLRYAAISDRGLIRSGNQDSVYAGPRLIAVADGMGGMAAGDLASSIVISSLAVLDEDVPRGELSATLADAVEESNAQIRATVDEHPEMEGMGTTLTAFLFSGSSLGMVHIGDSRAYRLRGRVLSQVTKDDTYVQMLVDEGQLSPDEAETHPQRSLLLRALGSNEVEPTFATLEAVAADRYMLCSDGLSGVVSDETLEEILNTISDPHQAADRLVQLALRGGGPDNVTVLVADLVDSDDVTEGEPIVAGAAAAGSNFDSSADPSTAAARAAATTAPPEPEPKDEPQQAEPVGDEPKNKSHKGRWYALAVVLLVVILGSAGYLVYQSQYYVGVDKNDHAAVFKGFEGELFGIPMSTLEASSDRKITDLTPDTRKKLDDGIAADGRKDAYRIMNEVVEGDANLLEPCPSSDSSSSQSTTDPSSPSSSDTDESSSSGTSSKTPDSSQSSSNSASKSPEPGVDCRSTD